MSFLLLGLNFKHFESSLLCFTDKLNITLLMENLSKKRQYSI